MCAFISHRLHGYSPLSTFSYGAAPPLASPAGHQPAFRPKNTNYARNLS